MTSLSQALNRVATEYHAAINAQEPFAQHPLQQFIRHDLRDAVAEALAGRPFRVDASGGMMGKWARVPWAAVMNPLITESTMRGYFVVYLLGADCSWHLSLNQGVTAVKEEFGSGFVGRLGDSAAYYKTLLSSELADRHLSTGPIALRAGDVGDHRGYETGNIASLEYAHEEVPADEQLAEDLREMLALYNTLHRRLQGLELDDRLEVLAGKDLPPDQQREFKMKLRTHEEAERAYLRHDSSDIRRVKEILGYRCSVCDLKFDEMYGEIGLGYIEAHHLTPYADLSLDDPPPTNTVEDFAVLCANCHRMVHKESPVLTPGELKARLNR